MELAFCNIDASREAVATDRASTRLSICDLIPSTVRIVSIDSPEAYDLIDESSSEIVFHDVAAVLHSRLLPALEEVYLPYPGTSKGRYGRGCDSVHRQAEAAGGVVYSGPKAKAKLWRKLQIERDIIDSAFDWEF